MNWADNILLRNALDKGGHVESIVATPYSEVKKITKGSSVYYLKKTPAPLFIESEILGFLHTINPAFTTPKLVDADRDNLCFLTQSCGEQTLRTLFAGRLNADALKGPVQEYQRIQKACVSHASELLAMGVLDWRLSRLPDIYERFVSDKEALARWGVEADTRQRLHELRLLFSDLCHEIADYNIPDTLNHSDFQENNMVIEAATGKVSIIDWGEVTISPALWPVVGFFKKICWRYKVPQHSTEAQALLSHFLEGWDLEPQSIESVYKNMSMIDSICYALSIAELEKNTGHPSTEWGARIKMALLSFSEASSAIGKQT